MQRRLFCKASMAAVVVALIPWKTTAAFDERLLWPCIAEPLANRRANRQLNFTEIHRCVNCKRDFYCPDRWLAQRCEVKAYCQERSWRTDTETCLPCKLGSEVDTDATIKANILAWREAHFV